MSKASFQLLKRVVLNNRTNHLYQLHYQTCFRHSNSHVNSLQPLRVTDLSSKRDRSRTDRHQNTSVNRRSSRTQIREEMQFLNEDDTTDSLDQLAHTVGKYSSKVDALKAEDEATRNLIKEVKFIRARTLRNKYFKKPPPPSLLTWSAKEQIRFLHRQDPETWSVKELAEKFPVSESSIKKILKSNSQLYRNEDILRHDEDVKNQWMKLKAGIDEDTEDPSFDIKVIKHFMNSQNDNLVLNATGIKHLPFPIKREKPFRPAGPFSSMVSDCYDTEEQKVKKEEEQHALSEQLHHISEILSDVSDVLQDTFGSHVYTRLSDSIKSKHTDSYNQSLSQSLRKETQRKYQEKEDSKKISAHAEDETNSEGFVPSKYKNSPPSSTASILREQHFQSSDESKKLNLGHLVSRKKKFKTYISGDCVYDQNGEFLYRIP